MGGIGSACPSGRHSRAPYGRVAHGVGLRTAGERGARCSRLHRDSGARPGLWRRPPRLVRAPCRAPARRGTAGVARPRRASARRHRPGSLPSAGLDSHGDFDRACDGEHFPTRHALQLGSGRASQPQLVSRRWHAIRTQTKNASLGRGR